MAGEKMKLVALKRFYHLGELIEKGAKFEFPTKLAREAIATGRAHPEGEKGAGPYKTRAELRGRRRPAPAVPTKEAPDKPDKK